MTEILEPEQAYEAPAWERDMAAPDSAEEPEPATEPTEWQIEAPAEDPAPALYEDAPEEPVQRPERDASGTRRSSRRSRRSGPRVPAYVAAVLTGLLTGVAGTGLTWAALRGCEALTGTDSCGGGPGLLILIAIVAVMVLLGAALLRGMRVADPGGTSFLAVGIVCVLVLVGLLDVVFSQWMFLAMPALGAAAYVLAHWVTTRFVDVSEEGPGHDVR